MIASAGWPNSVPAAALQDSTRPASSKTTIASGTVSRMERSRASLSARACSASSRSAWARVCGHSQAPMGARSTASSTIASIEPISHQRQWRTMPSRAGSAATQRAMALALGGSGNGSRRPGEFTRGSIKRPR